MVCIYCSHETEVRNSRKKARYAVVWRRRQCTTCVAQFTTYETPDFAGAIAVIRQKDVVPFNRDKLFLSIQFACSHREGNIEAASALTETTINTIIRKQLLDNGTINARALAKLVYASLRRFDRNAAATYKAHHQASLKL